MAVTLHINAEAAKVKHLRELGRLKNFDEIVAWMVTNAGAVEAELDELTPAELREALTDILIVAGQANPEAADRLRLEAVVQALFKKAGPAHE